MDQTLLDELKQFDTCILADALETFDHRLRNQGFTRPGLHCMTNCDALPVLGFAVTARVRSSDPPTLGNSYLSHDQWWPEMGDAPAPRIAVIQDVDPQPGVGACVGQVAAAIFKALHCVAVITNGAVRDLQAVAEIGLPVFAAHVSPSHSYAHIVDHGQPVEIRGLLVHAGDLLMADRHGAVSIPPDLAGRLPAVALDLRQRKRTFVAFCGSHDFSLEKLADEVKRLNQ